MPEIGFLMSFKAIVVAAYWTASPQSQPIANSVHCLEEWVMEALGNSPLMRDS